MSNKIGTTDTAQEKNGLYCDIHLRYDIEVVVGSLPLINSLLQMAFTWAHMYLINQVEHTPVLVNA